MARRLLGTSLLFTLLLTAVIGAIHARPYDDSGLRDFLTPPPDCATPCFMGIRIGRMTAGTVVEWLDRHPWVERVILSERFGATQGGYIGWRWNGQQPARLNGSALAALWIRGKVVRVVRVQTTIPLGELWLLHPPALGVYRVERSLTTDKPLIVHVAAYPDARLLAQISVPCPRRPADFWHEPVELQFYADLSGEFETYDLRGWASRHTC